MYWTYTCVLQCSPASMELGQADPITPAPPIGTPPVITPPLAIITPIVTPAPPVGTPLTATLPLGSTISTPVTYPPAPFQGVEQVSSIQVQT